MENKTKNTVVNPAENASEQLQSPPDYAVKELTELNVVDVLRTQHTSTALSPKVILAYDSISFSKACVELLPNTNFINVLIDRVKKRIIVLPVKKHAKDALKWCTISKKDGSRQKRVCTARKFGEKLYDMMSWVKENKYRILAYYQEIDGVQLLVFNLLEYEMVVPEFITTKTGKTMKRGKIYLPGEWEGFGMSLAEHSEANKVELNANYTLTDKDLNVTKEDFQIKGKAPSDEEIIMSQYRKEKSLEVVESA
jgi:hypothetical protein